MQFEKQLRRIQRFLRDPTAKIWSRELIRSLYNDTQRDMQTRSGLLEDVTVLRLPPLYQWAYIFDWESAHLPKGASSKMVLRTFPQTGAAHCYRWEAQLLSGVAPDVADEGSQFTQAWEAWLVSTPGQAVPIPFPANFHTTKLIAYDQKPIEYEDKRLIMKRDNDFLARSGDPVAYYREGLLENSFIPYPRPSTVVWNDPVTNPTSTDVVYTHAFESTFATTLSVNTARFGFFDSVNERQYVMRWEAGATEPIAGVTRGMWLFERTTGSDELFGMVHFFSPDTIAENLDTGTIVKREGSLVSGELGITVDVLDEKDAFLLIYDIDPTEISEGKQESDFPVFLRKYIEHGVLARAYGANTDGRIRSLSDYWRFRYNLSFEVLKRYRTSRRSQRNYRLRTQDVRPTQIRRRPRLPSTYPSI